MEKEIYLTETPYSPDLNDTRDKILAATAFPARPESAKPPRRLLDRFLPESYYDDKKIKPGISFYKSILEVEERRSNGEYKGPMLQIDVPQTVLLNDNSNSMIYTEEGIVKVEAFCSNEAFVGRVSKGAVIVPAVVHSSISGITFSNSIMMSSEIVGNKIIPRSQGFICRRYVTPYSGTPNLLRLYFSPRSGRQLKKNFAYKLVNLRSMDEDMFRKKHRLIHHYLVNSEKEDSYSLTVIHGKALQACEAMAESLTEYLEKGLGVRIGEMVLDFVVDEQRVSWLLQVRSIKSRCAVRLWQVGSGEELQLVTEKNNNSQMCRLCGMMYSKHQMEKIVTNKLIAELVKHLAARGMPFSPPHLRREGMSYVCDICYELIVAEHTLINVEKEFSSLLNISPDSIERVPSAPLSPPFCLKEEDFQGSTEVPKLKAWRLFFYLEKIKNYSKRDDKKLTNINLEMRFKNFREHFVKTIASDNPEASKVFKSRYSAVSRVQSAKLEKRSILQDRFNQSMLSHGKVGQTLTTLASKVEGSRELREPTRECFSIEKVKVYVLYTKKSQASIFANTEMQFSLTLNDERFTGRSATLQQLKNKDTCQRHSSQIFLFDEKLTYCNLELTVGLICDGEVVSDQDLQLAEVDGLYFPAKPHSICKPLPDEWMEVFTKGEEVPTHAKELSYEEIRQSHMRKESKLREQLSLIDL